MDNLIILLLIIIFISLIAGISILYSVLSSRTRSVEGQVLKKESLEALATRLPYYCC